MNFIVNCKRGSRRLGKLYLDSVEYVTPMCFMYTRSGTIPHIAVKHDLLEHNFELAVQLTLPTLVDQPNVELVKSLDKGIHSFIGTMIQSFLTVQDPAIETPTGYNVDKAVSVWTPGGRRQIDVQQFLSIVEAFRPNIVECLCDTIPSTGQTPKRIKKSVDRTLKFLDKIVQHKVKDNSQDSKCNLLGAIEGSDSLDERLRSAKETSKYPVLKGFVMEGFSDHPGDWPDLLLQTTSVLPENKPRFIQNIASPEDVIKAVECGIDVFDSSYPYQVTQRGCALVFPSRNKRFKSDHPTTDSLPVETKSDKNTQDDEKEPGAEYEINLNDSRFSNDLNRLGNGGCGCECCRCHSRAYIHHLLVTKEMLAQVLLMMHNLYQYYTFFQDIRRAIEDDQWEDLKDRFSAGNR